MALPDNIAATKTVLSLTFSFPLVPNMYVYKCQDYSKIKRSFSVKKKDILIKT